MKTAVIKTGGKQYVVHEGDRIKVEKIGQKKKEKIEVKDILLTAMGKVVKVGTPNIKGVVVEGIVLGNGRKAKITGVKMKAKKRYRKLYGHRQDYTEVEIKKIKTS